MKKAFDIGKYHSNGKRIGSGAYSNVYKGCDMVTGFPVAIKVVDLYHLTSREPQKKEKLKTRLKIEIRIAQETDHPNLVKMLDVFERDENVYLVFEFCEGGDFAQFLKKRGPLSEEEARFYLKQIVNGMQYLSENNIVHRDLKPPNILLKHDSASQFKYILKIADFGFAKQTEPDILSETICGSPLYMAPELLNRRPYSPKADLWSLGVILYEMVTGLQPIPAKSHLELLQNITNRKIKIPAYLSKKCKSLLMGLLRKKEEGRITMKELVVHPFLSDEEELLPRRRHSMAVPPSTKPIQINPLPKTYSCSANMPIPIPELSQLTLQIESPSPFSPVSFSLEKLRMKQSGSSSSFKLRYIYEKFREIEELFQLALFTVNASETVYLHFLILHMFQDLTDIIHVKIEEKKLRPSRKLAKIIQKSMQRYERSYAAIRRIRQDIDTSEKIPSFHEIIIKHVIILENQADNPHSILKVSYRALNSAIILLLLLLNWPESEEEIVNEKNIKKEIMRFQRKKKILRSKGSFSSSSFYLSK